MLKEKMVQVSPQLFQKEFEYTSFPLKGTKAVRKSDVDTITVTINGDTFDADEDSMNRLGRIVTIGNFQFNQAMSYGVAPAAAYKQVYKDTMIPWKKSNNQWGYFSVEVLCKVQEAALNKLAETWVKYG